MSDGGGFFGGGGFDLSSLFGSGPQAMQDTPLSPQGIPTGLDQAASTAGLPPLSSIVQGVNDAGNPTAGWTVNAQGQPVAPGQSQPVGSRLGSLLQQIAGGSTGAVQGLQNGSISPMQFLQSAAGVAKKVIGGGGGAMGGGGGGGGGAPAMEAPPQQQSAPPSMGLGTLAAQNFAQRYQPQAAPITPAGQAWLLHPQQLGRTF